MTADHGSEQGAGFARLLRTCRHAAGLTQAELAARAGVGVRTVRDLERGRASRPQRTTVHLLARALGLTGADRAGFHAAARGLIAVAPVPPTLALPPAVPLIGRDKDIAEIVDQLIEPLPPAAPAGPVCLVGLAGVGKSCLAITVAHQLVDVLPGGVAGVPVSEESTEADLLATIASVFGVPRADDLSVRFAAGPGLLVLDAVERAPVMVAAALRWLSSVVPTLRVLATGRHPLEVPGERVWPVAPLEVPPPDTGAGLETVRTYPAAALFLTRLGQVRREALSPDEVGALVCLVRRLGGLPLALELAAARGRVLDLNEMLHRYGDRILDLAGSEGTVTLREAVAESYQLLGTGQRRALRRLSVFRNRWSVELAESLLTDEDIPDGGPLAGDPVPLLDRLLALGMLGVRGSGPVRFRLLDVVRDFAAEQAALAGELAAARRRHAVVFAAMAARIAPTLAGPRLAAGVERLDEVTGDLWSALAYAANDDPPTALHLASRLTRWWRFRGRDVPGRQWLRRLLDDPRTASAPPLVRAWARIGVAQLAIEHGAGHEEVPAAEAALADFQRLGDVAGEMAARGVLAVLLIGAGDYERARRHGESALALAGRVPAGREARELVETLITAITTVGEPAAGGAGLQEWLLALRKDMLPVGEPRVELFDLGPAGQPPTA